MVVDDACNRLLAARARIVYGLISPPGDGCRLGAQLKRVPLGLVWVAFSLHPAMGELWRSGVFRALNT